MTSSRASAVQTFHQSIGKQLVARDPGASQVLGEIITFKEIKSFPIALSFSPRFLPFAIIFKWNDVSYWGIGWMLDNRNLLIFLLPLSTAGGRLRAEEKKRIKSHLFQIISHESGIQA
jgi:hypothetical protein